VTDRSQTLVATFLGAVVGGAAGYLLFTDHGRSLRRQMEPAIDDIARELSSFRATAQKAAGVASEGWKLVNETLGDVGPTPRYPGTRQTAPF
jgi:gas vesicle protein